jgi:hypothetical protein
MLDMMMPRGLHKRLRLGLVVVQLVMSYCSCT